MKVYKISFERFGENRNDGYVFDCGDAVDTDVERRVRNSPEGFRAITAYALPEGRTLAFFPDSIRAEWGDGRFRHISENAFIFDGDSGEMTEYICKNNLVDDWEGNNPVFAGEEEVDL